MICDWCQVREAVYRVCLYRICGKRPGDWREETDEARLCESCLPDVRITRLNICDTKSHERPGAL